MKSGSCQRDAFGFLVACRTTFWMLLNFLYLLLLKTEDKPYILQHLMRAKWNLKPSTLCLASTSTCSDSHSAELFLRSDRFSQNMIYLWRAIISQMASSMRYLNAVNSKSMWLLRVSCVLVERICGCSQQAAPVIQKTERFRESLGKQLQGGRTGSRMAELRMMNVSYPALHGTHLIHKAEARESFSIHSQIPFLGLTQIFEPQW